mmetsp:Transcript_108331/g.208227  ORF Transcript_108331/g.208227 Transcript_108331/m.208227 type:complete len:715 (-) Transcript_108331:375-2519(-)
MVASPLPQRCISAACPPPSYDTSPRRLTASRSNGAILHPSRLSPTRHGAPRSKVEALRYGDVSPSKLLQDRISTPGSSISQKAANGPQRTPTATTRWSSSGSGNFSSLSIDTNSISDEDQGTGSTFTSTPTKATPTKSHQWKDEVLVQTTSDDQARPLSPTQKHRAPRSPKGMDPVEAREALLHAAEWVREHTSCIHQSRTQLKTQIERVDKLLQRCLSVKEPKVVTSPRHPSVARTAGNPHMVCKQLMSYGYPAQIVVPSSTPCLQHSVSRSNSQSNPQSNLSAQQLVDNKLQEMLEIVRSDLCESVSKADSILNSFNSGCNIDISTLICARDKLIADLSHAEDIGLPQAEMTTAQFHRRSLHNAIQDLKGQVRVYCRVRPMDANEHLRGDKEDIRIIGDTMVESPLAGMFVFNAVFAPGSQEDVFEDCKDLVQSAIDGHNITIFSYGQTGAGKTYTMFGSREAPGVAFRMSTEVFKAIEAFQEREDCRVTVSGSIAEIYNNRLIDLLRPFETGSSPNRRPRLRQDKAGTVSVEDLTEREVRDPEALRELVDFGLEQRTVAESAMNIQSSRSHLIFTVKLTCDGSENREALTNKMVFCDLGGSERLKRTEAVGLQRKEAIEINKSLAALGDVIEAVAAKRKHVPYRNHTLTRLLQDSLGGSAKTLMFVHVSPADSSAGETSLALKFAARAGQIANACPPVAGYRVSHRRSLSV